MASKRKPVKPAKEETAPDPLPVVSGGVYVCGLCSQEITARHRPPNCPRCFSGDIRKRGLVIDI
jgi:hypothetical protein